MKKNTIQKETQGSKKIKNFLKDLIKNEKFVREIKRYIKINTTPLEKVDDFLLEKKDNLIINICLKYNINYNEFNKIVETFEKLRPEEEASDINNLIFSNDICLVSNNYINVNDLSERDKQYYEIFGLGSINEIVNKYAYPIKIEIRTLASKNDVIDFIDKKWSNIENLIKWRNTKKINIRERKNEEIYNLIYNNRELKTKDLNQKLKERLGITLAYYEINKIKFEEKKRRKKDISLIK